MSIYNFSKSSDDIGFFIHHFNYIDLKMDNCIFLIIFNLS